MNTITSLSEKIEQAKELDFGAIFSESIELFKKTWVQGLLLQVFTLIIMLPLIIVLYIPFIGLIIAQQESGYSDTEAFNSFFAGMSVLYIIFVIVGILVLGTITTALYAAFYRIMKKLDHDEHVLTSDFFYYIKGEFLSKIFKLMLLAIIITIPFALLCYFPIFYVMVPMSFFAKFFVFNEDLTIREIINLSFKLGNKKWLLSFGLIVLSFLCYYVLTLITCGIASLFLKPFMYHPTYLIYKKVIGFDEQPVIDETKISIE